MSRARRVRLAPTLLLLGALTAACSGTAGGPGETGSAASATGGYPGWPTGPAPSGAAVLPVLISSQLAVGANRFVYSLLDAKDQLTTVAAPDVVTELAFYDLARDPASPAATTTGTFIWAVQDQRGLYHASVTFSEAGDWGVQVTVRRPGQPAAVARVRFDVLAKATTPAVGGAVPASATLTASTPAQIAAISTDPRPDAAFYRLSVDQALAAKRPFAVVFATPQFCRSQICGPTLDTVKAAAAPFEARMAFIHVEPYVLQPAAGGGLQPALLNGNLQLVRAAIEWGIPSEPWIFVVGADGRLAAAFEGAVGGDELRAALQAVAGS